MNKEILEITKKFHDTYEKLASEYTYETREDTKVFDINSNNGKLMYATVNEIVSPILKGNQRLKEIEKEHQKINGRLHLEIKELKEKYMKLEDKYIHNVSCCNEEDCDLFCEHQELKLELSGYRQAILEDKDMLGLKEENQSLKKQLEEYKYSHSCSFVDTCKNVTIANYNQQKEFIEFLEKMWKETQDIWYIKILQKYKEIIGDKE